MSTRLLRNSGLLLIFLLFASMPSIAAAALNTISMGNTVFIGEQGLDISGAMGPTDTQIGWWASGASIGTSSPTQTITVTNPGTFYVAPYAFSGYTGNWYRIKPSGGQDGLAFNVQDPSLAIRVEDITLSLDRTNDWLPTGDIARFAIDSNLDAVFFQRGVGAPVTIHLLAPDGGEYSSVYGPGSFTHSIVDVPITTNPFLSDSQGISWDTGNSAYSQGTYVIWAECTLNGMKDNYAATGKSISSKVTVLNQDINPLIRSKTPKPTSTTIVTTAAPTTVKTTPPVVTTRKTPEITIVPPTSAAPVETPLVTPPVTSPLPSQTRAPGFELVLALSALVLGLAACQKKQ